MAAPDTTDEKWFWDIIARSRLGKKRISHATQIKNLEKGLSLLSTGEILRFDRKFRLLLKQSYTWDLWGAVFVINRGCSDDTFDYFRSWLIGQGQEVFYKAVADPETLHEILKPQEEYEWEGLEYAAPNAYETVAGKEIEVHDTVDDVKGSNDPMGRKWNEDELPLLFPKLWKSFSDHTSGRSAKLEPKKIDPTEFGATFDALEALKPDFWLSELSKRGHDVVFRIIGESESDPQRISQADYAGYLIQLRSRLTRDSMGILIKEMQFDGQTFDVVFQLYDKKLSAVFIDISLILCNQTMVVIRSGNVKFSSTEWKTYLETGALKQ